MKKMYEKPMAFEEAFVADEYVAACYFLACKRGSKGWDGNVAHWHYAEYGRNVSHSPLGTANTCGDKTANRVITDNGGVLKRFKNITVNKDGSMVLIVVMTIMIIVTHYLLEILFIGLHLVKIKIEDGTTMEPLSKRMLSTQIIHNLRILIETMNFTYIVIS